LRERIARAAEAVAERLDSERLSEARQGEHQAQNRWTMEHKAFGLRWAARIARETPLAPEPDHAR
jgi:hypothetical protein